MLSTGAQTRRVFGDDLLSAQSTLGTYHLTYDGQGTTRGVIDESGTLAESYAFDAYGEPRDGIALTHPLTDHLYTGEPRDAATGWTYLRARYLDTSAGTFNRLDPFFGNLDDPQSLHKYAYVHGDPANAWDPTGLFTILGLAGNFSIRSMLRTITLTSGAGALFAYGTGNNPIVGAVAGAQLGISWILFWSMSINDKIAVVYSVVFTVIAEILLILFESIQGKGEGVFRMVFRIFVAVSEGAWDAVQGVWRGALGELGYVGKAFGLLVTGLQQIWTIVRLMIKDAAGEPINAGSYLEAIIGIFLDLISNGGIVPDAASSRIARFLTRQPGFVLGLDITNAKVVAEYARPLAEGLDLLTVPIVAVMSKISNAIGQEFPELIE